MVFGYQLCDHKLKRSWRGQKLFKTCSSPCWSQWCWYWIRDRAVACEYRENQYRLAEIFLPLPMEQKSSDVKALARKLSDQLAETPEAFKKLPVSFPKVREPSKGVMIGWVLVVRFPRKLRLFYLGLRFGKSFVPSWNTCWILYFIGCRQASDFRRYITFPWWCDATDRNTASWSCTTALAWWICFRHPLLKTVDLVELPLYARLSVRIISGLKNLWGRIFARPEYTDKIVRLSGSMDGVHSLKWRGLAVWPAPF